MNVYVLEHNLLLFHSCGEKFLSACNFRDSGKSPWQGLTDIRDTRYMKI